jgi:hypothetical protein
MNPSKSVIGHKQYVKKKLQAFIAGTGQHSSFRCCYLIPKIKRKSKTEGNTPFIAGTCSVDEIQAFVASRRPSGRGWSTQRRRERPASPAGAPVLQRVREREGARQRGTRLQLGGPWTNGREHGARLQAAAGGAGRGTRARWPANGGAQLGALAAAGGHDAPPAVRLGVMGGLGNRAVAGRRTILIFFQGMLVGPG